MQARVADRTKKKADNVWCRYLGKFQVNDYWHYDLQNEEGNHFDKKIYFKHNLIFIAMEAVHVFGFILRNKDSDGREVRDTTQLRSNTMSTVCTGSSTSSTIHINSHS